MHHVNDVVIMQTSQLGQIELLEDKVHVLEEKVAAHDTLISNLVSNNLDHLYANMTLTQHINRLEVKWLNNKLCLCSIEGLLYKLRITYYGNTNLDPNSLGLSTLESGGDVKEGSDGGEDRDGGSAIILESMRPPTPGPSAPRERGLIEQMEEEAAKMRLGGWFNGEDQRMFPES